MENSLFIKPSFWNAEANDFIALFCIASVIILQFILSRHSRHQDKKVYSPALAWLRAISYFSVAYLIGWSSGVIDTLIEKPFITDEQISNGAWLSVTVFYILNILFGYLIIWKVGTFHDNRIYRWWLTPWFGMIWGFAQASVFMSIWALVEMSGWSIWITGLITYLLIGIYNGCWQQFYWDIYVSPPHNEKAFNMRKVWLAHTPNLVFSLFYLGLFGNIGIYFLMQGIALGISASIMHFPAWWDNYTAEAGATR